MTGDSLFPATAEIDLSAAAFAHHAGRAGAWRVGAAFVLSDTLCVLLAACLALGLRALAGGALTSDTYLAIAPAVALFVLAFWAAGLYPGIAINPVLELNRVVRSTTIAFLILLAASFFQRAVIAYSRAAILMAWVFCMLFVVLGRSLVRAACQRFAWWGVRAIVVGADKLGLELTAVLQSQPRHGLRVVALARTAPPLARAAHAAAFEASAEAPSLEPLAASGAAPADVFVNELSQTTFSGLRRLSRATGARYAIVALPDIPPAQRPEWIDLCSQVFQSTLLVPDLIGLSSFGVDAKDLGGALGLEIRHRLLSPLAQFAKRVVDLCVCLLLLAGLAPLFLLIALAIKWNSRGPVFYGQQRLGRGGTAFLAWKFRTMVTGAETVLAGHFEHDAALQAEWLRAHKLRRDPRITAVGRWLRRASLDELPQLWNVLCGQMSLVGPRPITRNEIERYGDKFGLYRRVVPGLTGLWQVSGRNNTTYSERVAFDEFYVRNWSVWLDIYILGRTVKVVLTGEGAY